MRQRNADMAIIVERNFHLFAREKVRRAGVIAIFKAAVARADRVARDRRAIAIAAALAIVPTMRGGAARPRDGDQNQDEQRREESDADPPHRRGKALHCAGQLFLPRASM